MAIVFRWHLTCLARIPEHGPGPGASELGLTRNWDLCILRFLRFTRRAQLCGDLRIAGKLHIPNHSELLQQEDQILRCG